MLILLFYKYKSTWLIGAKNACKWLSEFWEPDLAECVCGLAFLNQQVVSSWHPKLPEPRGLGFLIVFFCSELGLVAGSSASP